MQPISKMISICLTNDGVFASYASACGQNLTIFNRSQITPKLIEIMSLSVFELRNGAQHSPHGFQKSPHRENPAATPPLGKILIAARVIHMFFFARGVLQQGCRLY